MKVTPEILIGLGFTEHRKDDIYELALDLGKSYHSIYTYYFYGTKQTELEDLIIDLAKFIREEVEENMKEKIMEKLLK